MIGDVIEQIVCVQNKNNHGFSTTTEMPLTYEVAVISSHPQRHFRLILQCWWKLHINFMLNISTVDILFLFLIIQYIIFTFFFFFFFTVSSVLSNMSSVLSSFDDVESTSNQPFLLQLFIHPTPNFDGSTCIWIFNVLWRHFFFLLIYWTTFKNKRDEITRRIILHTKSW